MYSLKNSVIRSEGAPGLKFCHSERRRARTPVSPLLSPEPQSKNLAVSPHHSRRAERLPSPPGRLPLPALAGFCLAILLLTGPAPATTLPPELKAYGFSQAYYIEDGGVVISPYPSGFRAAHGVDTPEGIRIMPGGTFIQYESDRLVCEQYLLIRADDQRAFFHERLYRYHTVTDARGRSHPVRDQLLGTDDFYLTQFRALEWFDYAFPNIELHPGLQEWRSK